MKAGDLVRTDDWVWTGRVGMIISIQEVNYCRGAYVLFDIGVKLIRLENLSIIE